MVNERFETNLGNLKNGLFSENHVLNLFCYYLENDTTN